MFGDLEVTGYIRGTDLFGQIQDGGVVGFSTVNVSATLDAPDSDVYTLFEVEETGGNQWEYVVGGAPPAVLVLQKILLTQHFSSREVKSIDLV